MPWHIDENHAECAGYAVVKDTTNELEGCHRTRTQAETQLAALYASEPETELDTIRAVTETEPAPTTTRREQVEQILAELRAKR